MTTRTFVLDTSVLLSCPSALFAFGEHAVVLPLIVVKELESKRHDPELGYNARRTLRHLERLRVSDPENFASGVEVTEQRGTLRIEINHVEQSSLPASLRADRDHDTRILAVAKNLKDDGADVTLVSKDLPMRVLAQIVQVPAEEFLHEQVPFDDQYTGIVTASLSDADISTLHAQGLPLSEAGLDIPTHTGVLLRTFEDRPSGLAVADGTHLRQVRGEASAFGVKGRSVEQRLALHHMLNTNVGVVSLGGSAGTGKTLLALAAGLESVLERGDHKKVVVFRPLHSVGGQELGYLPGSEAEKMSPWAAAVYDALSAFVSKEMMREIVEQNLIEVLPLTHIRGRTLTDTWVVVDEAQNLERSVLLTALTRLGANSKAVLSWDVAQRDNLRVGRYDGIHAVVERLKGQPLFAHVTLTRSERSPVAAMVADLLDDGMV